MIDESACLRHRAPSSQHQRPTFKDNALDRIQQDPTAARRTPRTTLTPRSDHERMHPCSARHITPCPRPSIPCTFTSHYPDHGRQAPLDRRTSSARPEPRRNTPESPPCFPDRPRLRCSAGASEPRGSTPATRGSSAFCLDLARRARNRKCCARSCFHRPRRTPGAWCVAS